MKKLILFLTILFTAGYLFSYDQFEAGVVIDKVFSTPVVQKLLAIARNFLIAIGVGGLLYHTYHYLFGDKGLPPIFNHIIKIGFLGIILYGGAPFITMFVNDVMIGEEVNKEYTQQLNEAYTKLDRALTNLVVQVQEDIPAEEMKKNQKKSFEEQLAADAQKRKKEEEAGFWESSKNFIVKIKNVLSFQGAMTFVISFFIKGLLVIAMLSKYLMIDIFWPVFFQVTLLGFIFAVPFAALPGGMGAIKKFLTSVLEVSLHPVIYNFLFSIMVFMMVEHINDYVQYIHTPALEALRMAEGAPGATAVSGAAHLLANLPLLAKLLAMLLFMIFMAFLTPLFANRLVRHEGVGIAASAVTYSVGNKLVTMAGGMAGTMGSVAKSIGNGMTGFATTGGGTGAKAVSEAAAGSKDSVQDLSEVKK